MAANRIDDRHAGLSEAAAQVLHLSDPGMNVVILDALGNTDRECFHVASGHAAVGVQPFVYNDHAAGSLIEFRIVHRKKAANVDHRVFLGRHRRRIRKRTDFIDNVFDEGVLVAGLTLLNEVRILGNASHIMYEHDVVFIAPFSQLFEVGQ